MDDSLLAGILLVPASSIFPQVSCIDFYWIGCGQLPTGYRCPVDNQKDTAIDCCSYSAKINFFCN